MDNRDMETINHFIDEMQVFSENVVHTMDQQVSYVKKLNTRVQDNTRNIVELAKVLRQEMVNTLKEREVQGHKWLAFTSAIRDVEVALIQTREDLLQLQQSLDMTAMGKLSTTLVPPHNLSSILTQITRELPDGISLLMQPIIENMHVFYQVASVHACAIPIGIRLFIDIPLKGSDRYFEVFRPFSLPYYDQDIRVY